MKSRWIIVLGVALLWTAGVAQPISLIFFLFWKIFHNCLNDFIVVIC